MIKDIQINLNIGTDISKESCDALIAAVRRGYTNIPGWMLALGTNQQVESAQVSVNDAWAELIVRSNAHKMVQTVKSFFPEATRNRIVTFSEKEIVSHAVGRDTKLCVLGGFLIPESRMENKKTQEAVALEVAIECILFAQDSDPNGKTGEITTVNREAAELLNIPLFPIYATFGRGHKAADLDASMRNIDKKSPGTIVHTLRTNMPKMVPNKSASMAWSGVGFEPRVTKRVPNVKNQNTLFQAIIHHRKVRGADTGRRSLYSKGYYRGYMDNAMAKAMHLVADMESLARIATTGRFLEITQMDGMFSEIVLQSLVANKWVIRVINGYSLGDAKIEENGDVLPGVYRRVPKDDAIFFVHHGLDEKTPTMVNVGTVQAKKYEINLPNVMDRLKELVEPKTNRINFTYVYYRTEFISISKYMYPTSHAHAGQLIFCSLGRVNNEGLDLVDYFDRTMEANAYKTGFVYYRVPYFYKDPYAFKFSFNMTMKAKLKPEAWSSGDFSVKILEDYVQRIEIDYEILRQNSPTIHAIMQKSNGIPLTSGIEKEVQELIQLDVQQREEEQEHANTMMSNSSPVRPDDEDEGGLGDGNDFGDPYPEYGEEGNSEKDIKK